MWRPKIYLTSLTTVAAAVAKLGRSEFRRHDHIGRGPLLSITRLPPAWSVELIEGQVLALTPTWKLQAAAEYGEITIPEYGRRLRSLWTAPLSPGIMRIAQWSQPDKRGAACWDRAWWLAQDTVPAMATLVCTCPADKYCHRQIAAPMLVAAGWDVILDGRPMTVRWSPKAWRQTTPAWCSL